MSNELTVTQPKTTLATQSAFSSIEAFESAQRMAQALASSTLVPKPYQGKVADCILALEVAQRVGASPLMVMQNLDVIHGKTSWSAKYIIAALNSCGRFSPIEFELTGEGDDWGCVAVATSLATGRVLRGPRVTIGMAKKEGWYQKPGSKWVTMPELMLSYRAGSWFGRLHASDVLLGMRSSEEEREMIDVTPEKVVDAPSAASQSINAKVKAKRAEKAKPVETAPVVESAPEPITEPEVMPPENPPAVEVHF